MKKLQNRLLLSSPTMHSEEIEYINEAFERNWIAPLGFNCDGFENEMTSYLDSDNCYALATVSGTSAIHLSLKLAGVRAGDKILCSDLTFAATVNPVFYEKCIPILIDSESDTWNMCPEALEEGFRRHPEARVVIMAHLYGIPGKIDIIREVCNKHGAILIEDAAEALGSEYKGKKCGTFGDYNALSFNGNKIITTSGGGMLITKNVDSREKALFWSTQAREKAPWYQHEEYGYNYRMSNVVAGIGRGQLQHLEEHKEKKEIIYHRYEKGFSGIPVKMNPYLEDTSPNFWLSCMTIDKNYLSEHTRSVNMFSYKHEDGKTCPDEIACRLNEYNIETRPIWKPMHMQPLYKEYEFISTGVGEDIFDRGICLPSDIKMSRTEQDVVVNVIRDLFN